ncbi:hypothetical protein QQF54_09225 [Lelliottia sp. V106_10]|nr:MULTISPECIES: hypothetical protein [unclassified Lelliottia]MDK9358845.1 hypothetical protein [Lelliottia sp. V106_16]MDK9373532.1 hypothetical protein [Lelliottia sp. V106_10]MDK9600427.1 hypothetical protein [Lelliottia sp. V106_5]
MARKLSLSIAAEGVETPLQVDYLNRQGIQLLQGYYFYRPVPLPKLVRAVMTREADRYNKAAWYPCQPAGEVRIPDGISGIVRTLRHAPDDGRKIVRNTVRTSNTYRTQVRK